METKTTTIRTRTKAPLALVRFTAEGEAYLTGYAYTHAAADPRARRTGATVLPVEGGKVVATTTVTPPEAPCPGRAGTALPKAGHLRHVPGVGACLYCGEVAGA